MSALFRNDKPGVMPPSWYAATADIPPIRPGLGGDARADVCIVGAGYTGLWAALTLAQKGFKVIVLDAHRAGFGASGRNGGQVTGSLSGDGAMGREFRRVLGDATDDYIWNLRWRGHAIIKARVARFGIRCDLKHGHIQTATKPAHVTALRALYAEAQARGLGADVEWVEGPAMQGVVESPLYLAGLVNRRNMHLHPLNLVRGEAQAAASLGVRIFEDTTVLDLHDGPRPTVRTATGSVTADTVMLAANAYHRLGRGRMRGALFPASLGITATAPLPEATAQAINPQDLAIYDNRFVLDYHRLTADRRLIFGGGTSYSGATITGIAAILRPSIEAT